MREFFAENTGVAALAYGITPIAVVGILFLFSLIGNYSSYNR